MSAAAKEVDKGVIQWLCDKEKKKVSNRMRPSIIAVGARAAKLPDSVWPSQSTGALSSASGYIYSRLTCRVS